MSEPMKSNWMPMSPCKDCQYRSAGCHSKCIQYIDYRQQIAINKAKYKESRSLDDNYNNLKRYTVEKTKKQSARR